MKLIYCNILLFFCQSLQAQNTLTLEQAVRLALKNNFDIYISRNEAAIDKTNNSPGNAGMLPNVNLFLNNNNSLINTSQTQADGSQRTLNGAKNMSLNYGIALDWTIFDGLKMFARKEQLKLLQQQGEAELQNTILTKISEVYSAYYLVVIKEIELSAVDSTLKISNQRLKHAQLRYNVGKVSKLELLNAAIDYYTDSSSYIQARQKLKVAMIDLNLLIGNDPEEQIKTDSRFFVDESINLNNILDHAQKQNPSLTAMLLAKNIKTQELKQIKANRYPTLRLSTGYTFTQSEASLGFITQSRGNGVNYGITAAMPLYNGSNQVRSEKIAKLEIENVQKNIEKQQQLLQAQISNAYELYKSNITLSKLEEKKFAVTAENMLISLAKYEIGTIPYIEFRTAQQHYFDALIRIGEAQYQAKIYEIKLNELAGLLRF